MHVPSLAQVSDDNVLDGRVDVHSDDFKANVEVMGRLTQDLRAKLEHIRQGASTLLRAAGCCARDAAPVLTGAVPGGGERAREKHVKKGKWFVRDRINSLLDPGCGACGSLRRPGAPFLTRMGAAPRSWSCLPSQLMKCMRMRCPRLGS